MQEMITGNAFLVLAVLLGVAALLLVEGLYLLWRSYRGPEASRLKQRLRALSATSDGAQIIRQRLAGELPWAERLMRRAPRLRQLDRMLLQSGLEWQVGGVLAGSAFAFLLVLVLCNEGLRLPLTLSLAAAAGASALPIAWVQFKRARRLAKLQAQLPDAMDLMGRALRAGHAFSAALKMAGEEMPEPIAGELRTVHDEINFGISLPQALNHLAERVPLPDLRYFTVAVLIQRESGGNLTEILDQLSRLLRERARLHAKVRVLSSEGRLSAWILIAMPFALAGILAVFNPTFIEPLWTDPIGISMIKVLLTMMAIGALVMRRIVRIRI